MAVNLIVGTNSYVSVADADTYFAMRLYADTWISASTDDKAKALIMATSKIERQRLRGIKADTSQALQFPRAFYVGQRRNYYGFKVNSLTGWIVEDSISYEVKYACCEEALQILNSSAVTSASRRNQLRNQGVTSFSLGNLSESYATGGTIREQLLSIEAKRNLSKYLAGVAPIC